tara:strand:+ start:2702 stop:2821 length:120 start_codon:yes stop_codon:yes gene_type:complete
MRERENINALILLRNKDMSEDKTKIIKSSEKDSKRWILS